MLVQRRMLRLLLRPRLSHLIVLALIGLLTVVSVAVASDKFRMKVKLAVFGAKWKHYDLLEGYYTSLSPSGEPLGGRDDYIEYNPYRKGNSPYLESTDGVRKCFLDRGREIEPVTINAYTQLPQDHPDPQLGSHRVLGLRDDVCFDRSGRLGPYGLGNMTHDDFESVSIPLPVGGQLNWSSIDLGAAQEDCYQVNKHRFQNETALPNGRRTVPRTAIIVRSWTGFQWTPYTIMNVRALVNEVALGSGGEYTVHLLVHVKDNDLLFWESDELHESLRNSSVPAEFHNLVTLWSERQVAMDYPGPYVKQRRNRSGAPVTGVYRSSHLAIQKFAMTHPEYDFFWNWEQDVRYTGHYYEFFDRIGQWSREQPRKGLWERNAKYFVEGFHGDWSNFSQTVMEENAGAGNKDVWGPTMFHQPPPSQLRLFAEHGIIPPTKPSAPEASTWGVGEDADVITLNPMFDPTGTGWYFEDDVTGYDLDAPAPSRRSSIIAVARFSRKVLNVMHEETLQLKHTMWTEMWPPSLALQYGLKAVYAPHPIYLDRAWPVAALEGSFNGGKFGSTGGNHSSPFYEEHYHHGSTWYCNSQFAGDIWRYWLGNADVPSYVKGEQAGAGQACLRPMLLHPVKYDDPRLR